MLTKKTRIATHNESSLHDAIKRIYATGKAQVEIPVDGYQIDVIKGRLLIEIQTRSFSSIKVKLARLLPNHKVHLVYPLIVGKQIVLLDKRKKKQIHTRKSPHHGELLDIVKELIYIPAAILHKNLTLDVIHVNVRETRTRDGKGSWRRKGVSIVDRELVSVLDHHIFKCPADYKMLLPKQIPKEFTTKDLSEKGKIPRSMANRLVYFLRKIEVIYVIGQKDRFYLYRAKKP